MSFGAAIRSVLTQYATFSGRARRSEFWYWYLAVVGVVFVVSFLGAAAGASQTALSVVAVVFSLAILLPSLAVAARRLHDIGASGWWLLLNLIPFGSVVLLVLALFDSKPEPNRYGPSPKPAVG